MHELLPPHSQPLPVDGELRKIVSSLRRYAALVVTAPPGTGKTTRIPPALLAASDLLRGRVVVLEPRRMAVRAAARRIAQEWRWKVGHEIGYRIRFDHREKPDTRLLIVTEGVLVRMLQADPFLEGMDCLIFDEIHERSIDCDLALAMARRVQLDARPDLRIVAMSATLDPGPLASYLGHAPVVEIVARNHPIETIYLEQPPPSRLSDAVFSAVQKLLPNTPGNILVFLPGMAEIRHAMHALKSLSSKAGFDVEALHGSLSPELQDAVLLPRKRRKVVLTTNVAETSLTVPGVTSVVDSGLAKVLRHDNAVGLDRLETSRIAQANADQRAGRAGREQAGICLRLWTRADQVGRPVRESPEITRLDLSGAVLQLLDWGEKDLRSFPFFECPEKAQLDRAQSLLRLLGLLDDHGVSPLGHRVARLPLPPRLGRLVAETHMLGDKDLGCLAAALLSDVDPFRRSGPPGDVPPTYSDLQERLDALRSFSSSGRTIETAYGSLLPGPARRILRAADQIERQVRRAFGRGVETGLPEMEILGRSLLVAFPDRLARMRSKGSQRALLVGGRGARLSRQTGVRSQTLLVALNLDAGRRGQLSEAQVHMASGIEHEWLPDHYLSETIEVEWHSACEEVRSRKVSRWRDLELESVSAEAFDAASVEAMLVEAARANLDKALGLDESSISSFLTRIHCLRNWMPELDLPSFDHDAIANLLPLLANGRHSFAELRRAPLIEILKGLLSSAQHSQLELHAPISIEVPSGNSIRLTYEVGSSPVLAVRIQELFGLATTPTVAAGRVKVLLHLLAPNYRPQQVTDDLLGFWNRTYPEVRRELRGRYAKHSWPEDPLTAPPTSRIKRRRGG